MRRGSLFGREGLKVLVGGSSVECLAGPEGVEPVGEGVERPRRIVEVGAGHSTRFAARAIADGGFPCRITAIDPAPRAALDGLAAVTLLRAPVHRAGLAPFDALEAGDVSFVDSSHVLMPGTDVDFLLNRVLPRLPAAVLVHFHDVFLPDDYPAGWAWRGYNEQLAVAALLTAGGYAPVFASHYVATRMRDSLRGAAAALPRLEGAIESSLWLRKRQGREGGPAARAGPPPRFRSGR